MFSIFFDTHETPMIGEDKYFYYTNDKMEAWEVKLSCPRLHNCLIIEKAFNSFIKHIFVQDLLCAKKQYIKSKKYSSENDMDVPSGRFCYIGEKDIGKR